MKARLIGFFVVMTMWFSSFGAHAESTAVIQMVAHQPVTPGYMVARISEKIAEDRLPSVIQHNSDGSVSIPPNFWEPEQLVGDGWMWTLDTEGIEKFVFSTNTASDELRMTSDTLEWVVTEFPSGDPLWLTKAVPQNSKAFLPVIVR